VLSGGVYLPRLVLATSTAAARASSPATDRRRGRAAPSAVEACDPAGLSAATPDVIVADYQLAGGATGIEAISAIRIMLGRSVPALLLTGSTSQALGAARAGGFPLLRKPVAPAKLRAALTQLVRR
jgi:two-component system, sensor histidine kinase